MNKQDLTIINEVIKNLAHLLANYPEYKSSIEEIHHTKKLDQPSGTAILLAEGIIENNENLNEWKLDEEGDDILTIEAKREGEVPGTHIIRNESGIDNITLIHEAKSRKGFAIGAVLAAEFLPGKIGNYTMKDLIKLNL